MMAGMPWERLKKAFFLFKKRDLGRAARGRLIADAFICDTPCPPSSLADLQQFWNCVSAAGTKKERKTGLEMSTKSLESRKRKTEAKHEEDGDESEDSEEDSKEQKYQKRKTSTSDIKIPAAPKSSNTCRSEYPTTTASPSLSLVKTPKS